MRGVEVGLGAVILGAFGNLGGILGRENSNYSKDQPEKQDRGVQTRFFETREISVLVDISRSFEFPFQRNTLSNPNSISINMNFLANLRKSIMSQASGRQLVGTDRFNNHYFVMNDRPGTERRIVVYPDDDVRPDTVPAQWYSWLQVRHRINPWKFSPILVQHLRKDPPTLEEIKQEEDRRATLAARVKQLEAEDAKLRIQEAAMRREQQAMGAKPKPLESSFPVADVGEKLSVPRGPDLRNYDYSLSGELKRAGIDASTGEGARNIADFEAAVQEPLVQPRESARSQSAPQPASTEQTIDPASTLSNSSTSSNVSTTSPQPQPSEGVPRTGPRRPQAPVKPRPAAQVNQK